LAGGVEDLVNQRRAVAVAVAEDVAGDLDEVRVEVALVPLGKHLVHLVGAHAQAVLHQVVRLADELHVAVLDAVVHHLDVVAGSVVADPVAARRAVIDLGRDGLENSLHVRPGVGVATRHDRGAVARAFLATGDAGADEEQSACAQVFGAADAVLIE